MGRTELIDRISKRRQNFTYHLKRDMPASNTTSLLSEPLKTAENQDSASIDLEELACDLCGSWASQPFLNSVDRNWAVQSGFFDLDRRETVWHVARCQQCGLMYLNPRPTRARLLDHYPRTYYAYTPGEPGLTKGCKETIKHWLRGHQLPWSLFQGVGLGAGLRDVVTDECGWVKPGSFLDVGCGSGVALSALARLGWKTFGIDVSNEALNQARIHGHTVWLGDLTDVDIPQSSMDVINMSHVLEHMPSPRNALASARTIVRPGGRLFIEVPNAGAFGSAVFRSRSWNWDLPRHFYHFTQDTLTRLVTDAGFDIIRLKTKSTSRYLVQSMAVSLLENDELTSLVQSLDPKSLLSSKTFQEVLEPFCEMLRDMGQGNILRLVAQRAR